MKHIHYDCIVAWANGAKIQYEYSTDMWIATINPTWGADVTYRIKPEEVKKETRWVWIVVRDKGKPLLTSCFYTEQEALALYSPDKVQKAEWSATEFEVKE